MTFTKIVFLALVAFLPQASIPETKSYFLAFLHLMEQDILQKNPGDISLGSAGYIHSENICLHHRKMLSPNILSLNVTHIGYFVVRCTAQWQPFCHGAQLLKIPKLVTSSTRLGELCWYRLDIPVLLVCQSVCFMVFYGTISAAEFIREKTLSGNSDWGDDFGFLNFVRLGLFSNV